MDINTQILNDWADEVGKAFLDNQINPSESVTSIVQENDLNIEQTKRLCEASNLSIKRTLKSTKIDDVSFPLASHEEVLGMVQPNVDETPYAKEGSLKPDSAFRQFCRYAFFEHGFDKTASAFEMGVDHYIAVSEDAGRKSRVMRRDLTGQRGMVQKISSRIMNYLQDEARATKNLNGSFTAVCQHIDTGFAEDYYKKAHKLITESHVYAYPGPEIHKLAGRVSNPTSEIVVLFRKYAKEIEKMENMQAQCERMDGFRKKADQKISKLVMSGMETDGEVFTVLDGN
jgi:hypothetical protein